MNDYAPALAKLKNRLPEISDYYRLNALSAEPHRYPKNLFKAQKGKAPFKIASYLHEIRDELSLLAKLNVSSLEMSFRLQKVTQQIQVLVTSGKSAKSKGVKISPIDALKQTLDTNGESGLVYLQKQETLMPDKQLPKDIALYDKQLARLAAQIKDKEVSLLKEQDDGKKKQYADIILGLKNAHQLVIDERQKALVQLEAWR